MGRQDLRIIVEGMDGAGKTTLINRLMYDFDDIQFEVIHNDLGPNQNFDKWWPEQLNRPKSPVVPIHDRFFFSEIVYGPVLRGSFAASEILITNVAFFLRQLALLIYARPHSDILRESIQTLPQMDGVQDSFQPLLEMYDQIMTVEMSWFRDRFIRYDWNNPESYPAVAAKVRAYLDGEIQ